MNPKTRIINIYAGPSTGKSTIMSGLFHVCKDNGLNTEMIPEFAKDAAWEGRGEKFFRAQDYIYGCQSFRVDSIIDDVEFAITDSPVLQALVYVKDDYGRPALRQLIREHHHSHDSINIFLKRNKPYNPKGRLQTEAEAKELDARIMNMLHEEQIPFYILEYSRKNPLQILELMAVRGWIPYSVIEQEKQAIKDLAASL